MTSKVVSQILARQISQDVSGVKNTFSSWDSCMSKSYCKWPVIAAIIVASLIILSLLACCFRCLCCGVECCCACCKCCNACCPSPRRSRADKQGAYNAAPQYPPPAYGYQQPPPHAPMQYGPPPARFDTSAPTFATFESTSGKPANDDALPAMPSWANARERKVEYEEPNPPEEEKDSIPLREQPRPSPMDEAKLPMLASPSPNPGSPSPFNSPREQWGQHHNDQFARRSPSPGGPLSPAVPPAAVVGAPIQRAQSPYAQPRRFPDGQPPGQYGPGPGSMAYSNPRAPGQGPGQGRGQEPNAYPVAGAYRHDTNSPRPFQPQPYNQSPQQPYSQPQQPRRFDQSRQQPLSPQQPYNQAQQPQQQPQQYQQPYDSHVQGSAELPASSPVSPMASSVYTANTMAGQPPPSYRTMPPPNSMPQGSRGPPPRGQQNPPPQASRSPPPPTQGYTGYQAYTPYSPNLAQNSAQFPAQPPSELDSAPRPGPAGLQRQPTWGEGAQRKPVPGTWREV